MEWETNSQQIENEPESSQSSKTKNQKELFNSSKPKRKIKNGY